MRVAPVVVWRQVMQQVWRWASQLGGAAEIQSRTTRTKYRRLEQNRIIRVSAVVTQVFWAFMLGLVPFAGQIGRRMELAAAQFR